MLHLAVLLISVLIKQLSITIRHGISLVLILGVYCIGEGVLWGIRWRAQQGEPILQDQRVGVSWERRDLEQAATDFARPQANS